MKGVFILLFCLPVLFSCSTYKTVERHLNRKMDRANLTESVWVNNSTHDTIEYWDNGVADKPTLVLIHGFGASTKYQFYKQVAELTQNYRLVLPNLYQFGNSRPGDTNKCTVSDQVDLVSSLIDHLEIDSFSIIGVSYGGLIGIELASKRQHDVNQLVLFDAVVKYLDSSDIQSLQNQCDVSTIEELFAPSEPKGLKKLLFLANGKKSPIPAFLLREFHQEEYIKTLSEKRALITCLIDDLQKYQQREYNLDMPILLMWGEKDIVVSADRGRRLKEHLGDSCEFRLIENAAHMPNMTHTKAFNRILMDFLIP